MREDEDDDGSGSTRAMVPTEPIEPREDGYNQGALDVRPENATQMAAIARERFQLEALVSQARMYPRDEYQCFQSMTNAAKRATFAAVAEYRYQRGGKPVVGVSVKAARPLALYWKYVRFGWTITRYDEEGFGLRGFAHDVQNGAIRETDAEGRWVHQRRNRETGRTEWLPVTDERDRREIMGKAGAIAERNAILGVIPPDIVEDFIAECRKTNQKAARGDLTANRQQTIRAFVATFGELGVTSAMLEAKIGHPLEQLSAEELADLRVIGTSIREGEPVSAFFSSTPGREPTPSVSVDLSQARAATPVDPPGGQTLVFPVEAAKPKPKERDKQ